jgi:hypothetical protein
MFTTPKLTIHQEIQVISSLIPEGSVPGPEFWFWNATEECVKHSIAFFHIAEFTSIFRFHVSQEVAMVVVVET